MMTDFSGGLTPYNSITRPRYSKRNPSVLLWPPGVSSYWGTAGDIMDYDDSYSGSLADGTFMVIDLPESFDAELVPERFEGGRSAANIRFKDRNRPYTYLMDARSAVELIKNTGHPGGMIRGNFKLVKKGSNIRLFLVDIY
jgi:hypothetical protein